MTCCLGLGSISYSLSLTRIQSIAALLIKLYSLYISSSGVVISASRCVGVAPISLMYSAMKSLFRAIPNILEGDFFAPYFFPILGSSYYFLKLFSSGDCGE